MSVLPCILLLSLAGVVQAQAPATDKDVPIPAKQPPPATDENAPTVSIRAGANGDRVEEYRQNGQVFMVRVTPRHGRAYYLYDDDHNGRMDRSDAEKNDISPVYWTLYEWDANKPRAAKKKR
ncbi:MAG: DUF2782 domain-containing protein [Arenimonas sp.]